MKKYISILSTALLLTATGCDNYEDVYQYDNLNKSIDWNEAATASTDALISEFWNEEQGYFNYNSGVTDGIYDNNYWPQAHAMDVVIDAFVRNNDSRYSDLFDKWYEGVKKKNGGSYYNNFYDDEEWIALTMLRLYEVTSDQKYLNTALDLWADITTAWNTDYAGGGMAWTHDQPWQKNACSNGPASLIACRLYELDGQKPEYLEWAQRIYNWQRTVLFNPATGAVSDGLNGATETLSDVCLTYNQGTFLATCHRLYSITDDIIYLKDARRCANYCISHLIDAGNNVLRDEGSGDNGLFKGIFMRYFLDFIQEPDLESHYRNKFSTFFCNNAAILWSQGIADKRQILFGPSWTVGPMGSTQLTSMTSGCTLMEMRARYEIGKNE